MPYVGEPFREWHLAGLGSFGGVAQNCTCLMCERGSLKSCPYGRQFTQMCERDAAPRCASEAAEAAVGPAGRVGDGSAALLLGLRLGRLRGLAK